MARPMVTFPAEGNHCPLTSTKLYSLVTEAVEAHVCEQLAQGCYLTAEQLVNRTHNMLSIKSNTQLHTKPHPSMQATAKNWGNGHYLSKDVKIA